MTLIFDKFNYTIEVLLWRDEVEYLQKVLTFPSSYKIYEGDTKSNHLTIKLSKTTEELKQVYKKLNRKEFVEYIVRILQGY